MDVSSFTIDEIYDLYYAIAEKDHAFRMQSLYGAASPPVGHCEFRPLCRESFTQRIRHYDTLDGGQIGRSLRDRLARQAAAYGVEYQSTQQVRRRAA